TLMRLLEESIYHELPDLMKHKVRLRVIGRAAGVPLPVRRGLEHVARETRDNTGLTLLVAFNYGGRDELLDALRVLARPVLAGARVAPGGPRSRPTRSPRRTSARRSTQRACPIPIC